MQPTGLLAQGTPIPRLANALLDALLLTLLAQQIRRTKDRPPRKVPCIDGDDVGILAVLCGEVLGDGFSMGQVVVDGDEGRRDVGLVIQVREAESRER